MQLTRLRNRLTRGTALAALPALLTAGLVTGAVATAAPASAAAPLPVIYNFPAAVVISLAHPNADPPGANDFSCRPSAAHPRPVVLVHGTLADKTNEWQALSPLLKNDGYCVFAPNIGGASPTDYLQGTRPIEESSAQLATFVDQVLAATGASKVDIVGHSQGGMLPRYYINNLGGEAKVNALIGLAPSNHGTTLLGLTKLADVFGLTGPIESICQSCTQQIAGSPFLTALNAGGGTRPGVRYTVIETRYDEIVTPYTSAFLPGPNVRNITLQDSCILDGSDHISVAYDRVALRHVQNALDPQHPRPLICVPVLPAIGG
ncbi:alpha/beta fold hydrolase [Pseudofrankia sp. BMG5.37]|uniref:esterase/lipase family protein n=1 Tax=Pseudofrankia sp. BMG5.37 TaxID=3050035 RepID=UPI0028955F47|nr:alpha/beta fold hydrolase [Pseudofrankia sp. BMG5.37]MDT3438138.1 alpha/beta fold hydrolase [Pseudofrankia sp. BMG5.37]